MTENRLKFRVYDIRRKVYFNDPVPPLNSDGTLAFQSSHPDFQKYYITEQCTGLSDKNGNLIYEGDVVKSMIRTGYIKWHKGDMAWYVYVLKSNEIIALNSYLDGELEIIGNIHEQAEQKDK